MTKSTSLLITYCKLSDLPEIIKIDDFFDAQTDKVYKSNKKKSLLNAIKIKKIIVANWNGKLPVICGLIFYGATFLLFL